MQKGELAVNSVLFGTRGSILHNSFVHIRVLFIATLRSRCRHYILVLFLLLSFFFFSSPNLSGRRLDVYHTSIHGEALVRI